MKYWVMKGTPNNDWDQMQHPGKLWTWVTKRPPKNWEKGDRIFCYESSPSKKVVGLADLHNTYMGEDKEGRTKYKVRFLTTRFTYTPNINELRAVKGLEEASFLKSGPASTILSLSEDHARNLFEVLLNGNPEIASVWPGLMPEKEPELGDDVDRRIFELEGRKYFANHLRSERSRTIVLKKKAQALAKYGKLECEVCKFDFKKVFGTLGENFCEVHHLAPLGKSNGRITTELKDLSVVCSNCHRMLHRLPDGEGILDLRRLIRQ
jgi:hypothetical protein